MNRQEVYNRVRDHLLQQNQASRLYPDSSACAYRGLNGTKCAIGCLITDEHYKPDLENKSAVAYNVRGALAASLNVPLQQLDSELSFLSALQDIHDLHHPALWFENLQDFAKKYGLQP